MLSVTPFTLHHFVCYSFVYLFMRVYHLQLDEAVTAIKAAMTWDEAAFGREFDLVRPRHTQEFGLPWLRCHD